MTNNNTQSAAPIRPIDKGDAPAQSENLIQDNIHHLKTLFPEAFTEGRIDFDVLKSLLGAEVDDREEKYGLNWHGKRRARQLALTPSTGTLRPCPEESVDWDTTKNLMIEGDNLEVLKLLQKSYAGKVKLIYIDPPYNTGKDFVYPDNFQDSIRSYLELTGQVESGQKITSNTETSGRFHTDWLNMMYPRLKLARGLLRDDGLICISIDDNESARLRVLCDEVFGEENFVAAFVWQKRVSPDNDEKHVTSTHDYVLCYMRDKESHKVKGFSRTAEQDDRYQNPDGDLRGVWTSSDLTRREYREHDFYEITLPSGRKVLPAAGRSWSVPPESFQSLVKDNRIWFGPNGDSMPRTKRFLTEVADRVVPVTWLTRELSGDNQGGKRQLKLLFPEVMDIFETPKPVELVMTLVRMFCEPDDVVLDFFAGTGTTGDAVMRINAEEGTNRRFFLVQLPEPSARTGFATIADLTKERLRRVGRGEGRPADPGFRVFKLDQSNVRAWNPNPDDLSGTLMDHTEHLVAGRSMVDVLYELLLKLGLDLTVPIEARQIANKEVHNIGAGALIVCLSDGIDRGAAEPLALGIVEWQKSLEPAGGSKFVFRDSAFADDVAKTNLAAILSQHGFDDVRSI
jgi:adenine-specific DNA-methyltransferase